MSIFMIQVNCCQDEPEGCVCGSDERVLRAYMRKDPVLPSMTARQRGWCLEEIGSVEGYDRSEYEQFNDADLARTVLYAWTDYCRDKGLL